MSIMNSRPRHLHIRAMVDGIADAEMDQTPTWIVIRLFPLKLGPIMEEVQSHRQRRHRVAYAWRSFQWPIYANSAQGLVAVLIV